MSAELTPANQDYLKVIWSVREWSAEPVTTTLLARRMGYSPSTISEAVKKLTAQGLLTHARYGAIELTEAGRSAALAMVRRHRLLETFLVAELDYSWDEVHDEAEVLEHAVTDRLVEALDARLGHPVRDPHGDPIPTSDGRVPMPPAAQLRSAPGGVRVRVARISDTDPKLLRYFADLGIELDTELAILDRKNFAGTLTLLVGDGDDTVEVGVPAAEAIWVTPTHAR